MARSDGFQYREFLGHAAAVNTEAVPDSHLGLADSGPDEALRYCRDEDTTDDAAQLAARYLLYAGLPVLAVLTLCGDSALRQGGTQDDRKRIWSIVRSEDAKYRALKHAPPRTTLGTVRAYLSAHIADVAWSRATRELKVRWMPTGERFGIPLDGFTGVRGIFLERVGNLGAWVRQCHSRAGPEHVMHAAETLVPGAPRCDAPSERDLAAEWLAAAEVPVHASALADALGWNQRDATARAGRLLKALGWTRHRIAASLDPDRPRVYRPPSHSPGAP